MSLRLHRRDLLLLEALALRIRLVGQRQAAESFWAGHLANARRRLTQLVQTGFLISFFKEGDAAVFASNPTSDPVAGH